MKEINETQGLAVASLKLRNKLMDQLIRAIIRNDALKVTELVSSLDKIGAKTTDSAYSFYMSQGQTLVINYLNEYRQELKKLDATAYPISDDILAAVFKGAGNLLGNIPADAPIRLAINLRNPQNLASNSKREGGVISDIFTLILKMNDLQVLQLFLQSTDGVIPSISINQNFVLLNSLIKNGVKFTAQDLVNIYNKNTANSTLKSLLNDYQGDFNTEKMSEFLMQKIKTYTPQDFELINLLITKGTQVSGAHIFANISRSTTQDVANYRLELLRLLAKNYKGKLDELRTKPGDDGSYSVLDKVANTMVYNPNSIKKYMKVLIKYGASDFNVKIPKSNHDLQTLINSAQIAKLLFSDLTTTYNKKMLDEAVAKQFDKQPIIDQIYNNIKKQLTFNSEERFDAFIKQIAALKIPASNTITEILETVKVKLKKNEYVEILRTLKDQLEVVEPALIAYIFDKEELSTPLKVILKETKIQNAFNAQSKYSTIKDFLKNEYKFLDLSKSTEENIKFYLIEYPQYSYPNNFFTELLSTNEHINEIAYFLSKNDGFRETLTTFSKLAQYNLSRSTYKILKTIIDLSNSAEFDDGTNEVTKAAEFDDYDTKEFDYITNNNNTKANDGGNNGYGVFTVFMNLISLAYQSLGDIWNPEQQIDLDNTSGNNTNRSTTTTTTTATTTNNSVYYGPPRSWSYDDESSSSDDEVKISGDTDHSS